MRLSLSFVLDVLFTAFISFILLFVFFNYFLSRTYAILFSALLSVLISLMFFKYRLNKHQSLTLKNKEKRECEQLMETLNFSTRPEVSRIFERALKNKGMEFERKRAGIYVKSENLLITYKFGFEQTTKSDLLKAYNLRPSNGTVHIFSENFNQDVIAFSERFDKSIILNDKTKTYNFLKENNALPSFTPKLKKAKANKTILHDFFAEKKASKYLAFGLMFLALSFLTVYKLYYVVFGGVLLIFALLCRLYGKARN